MSVTDAPRYLRKDSPPHLTTLILLASITALAMNVFLPSLPSMAEHFDAPYRLVQLSVAVFLATNGILQLFVGPLADKFGRRPVILWGLGIFCLATVGCLFAPNIGIFLFFRSMQATAAVAMVLSRAVVRDMHSADRAASVLGYVVMGMSVVPMIAPALGGVLDEAFGWQSTFWLLLGFGVLVFLIVLFDLGETGTPSSLTLVGQFREYPELLTSPRFWGYCMASTFASGAFFAFLGGAPYVASNVFGMSAAEFGYFTGAPAIGYFLGNWLTGLYAARAGVNRMILLGTLATMAGLGLSLILNYSGISGPYVFFGFMATVGLGNGLVLPSGTSGMLSVRPHLAGTASGLGGAIMILGGAMMSALAGVMLTPGSGEIPLIWLMFLTTCAAFLAILVVLWRERQLAR
ncbi:drug resistance transporter, Bcr/CflA family protein [Pseudooceanicola batsensis HTCC2597]|uniref:Bcr/CflA family efflux transporter n=1 Tax=Pseudooceanicola batsensis (strain ATCC BAA-863 / DSM 15984 / KCTC 12145 / HTCC2597) TaxID=252305 RepID=A3TYT6_PSEBH|nr:multidrug effflux MFS transporter [Pseudooceanicola batsensis]EAQ02754.1 drug resistance transporter, Bcr/CflA family protein [Pseudooceanicola batsensis HTCC2597]